MLIQVVGAGIDLSYNSAPDLASRILAPDDRGVTKHTSQGKRQCCSLIIELSYYGFTHKCFGQTQVTLTSISNQTLDVANRRSG